jgi:predicted transposase YbfD/YdcC
VDGFREIFGDLKDPRSRACRYDLTSLLFIALAASMCKAQTACEMAEFARSKRAWLSKVIDLPEGALPSHDTFSRVFRMLDAEAFEAAFAKFCTALAGGLSGVVAVDGKALKGAYERGCSANPLHLITLYSADCRMVIGQKLAPGRAEAVGVIEALALFDLKGCTVTADALHCRKDTAEAILARGGNYALALKANNRSLLGAAKTALDEDSASPPARQGPERGHDRHETRFCVVAPLPEGERYLPGATCVARITTERTARGKKTSRSERFYVFSQIISAEEALQTVRAHWGVENQAHWSLDTAFGEDACRTRKDNAPQNFALVRRIALNALRSHPAKLSLNIKKQKAGWDEDFLEEVFSFMR